MSEQLSIPGTEAVEKFDPEEFKSLAKAAAKAEESSVGLNFIKLTSSGVMTWNGAPVPNNELAAVIVGSIHENCYYGSQYDPDNPTAPICFAFGNDPATMAPHESCVKNGTAQSPTCAKCKHNEFGTATLGKGKACRNNRRVGLLVAGKWTPAGKYEPVIDPEYYASASFAFIKVPPTSIREFAGFITQLVSVFNPEMPPFTNMVKIKTTPNQKTQYKMSFEPVMRVPEALQGILYKRYKECAEIIATPYTPEPQETEGEKKTRGRKSKSEKY